MGTTAEADIYDVDDSIASEEDDLIEGDANLDDEVGNSFTVEKSIVKSCPNSLQFDPIHVMSVWKDPVSKDNRVSVAVLFTSGVAENSNNLNICVESDNLLKITVMWPSTKTSVPQLMQRWISEEVGKPMMEYHPQIQGFYTLLEKFQSREGDPIYSSASISLPFAVKSDFTRVLLGWEGTEQIVLCKTLFAPDRKYKKEDDSLVVQISLTPQLSLRIWRSPGKFRVEGGVRKFVH